MNVLFFSLVYFVSYTAFKSFLAISVFRVIHQPEDKVKDSRFNCVYKLLQNRILLGCFAKEETFAVVMVLLSVSSIYKCGRRFLYVLLSLKINTASNYEKAFLKKGNITRQCRHGTWAQDGRVNVN